MPIEMHLGRLTLQENGSSDHWPSPPAPRGLNSPIRSNEWSANIILLFFVIILMSLLSLLHNEYTHRHAKFQEYSFAVNCMARVHGCLTFCFFSWEKYIVHIIEWTIRFMDTRSSSLNTATKFLSFHMYKGTWYPLHKHPFSCQGKEMTHQFQNELNRHYNKEIYLACISQSKKFQSIWRPQSQ